MAGETDLSNLLKGMRPVLQDLRVVFATLPNGADVLPEGVLPIGQFREEEGLTLILDQQVAFAAGLACSAPMRQITLTIHSALEAVGLTAAFATALTNANISANVVAGYYHDHIFVPEADAERAVAVLQALSGTA